MNARTISSRYSDKQERKLDDVLQNVRERKVMEEGVISPA